MKAMLDKLVPVVGLDPHPSMIPSFYKDNGNTLFEATSQLCWDLSKVYIECKPVVKIQFAFFEALGPKGYKLAWDLASNLNENNVKVIADIKRSDIGSTAKAYADAYLNKNSPFHSITIVPYLGSDGIMPFLELAEKNNKMIWVVLRSSNPSGVEVQGILNQNAEPVFMELAKNWSKFSKESCGFVVGATSKENLNQLSEVLKHDFLVPGFGAQGAKLEDFIGINHKLWCSQSRSILFPKSQAISSRESYLLEVKDLIRVFQEKLA